MLWGAGSLENFILTLINTFVNTCRFLVGAEVPVGLKGNGEVMYISVVGILGIGFIGILVGKWLFSWIF